MKALRFHFSMSRLILGKAFSWLTDAVVFGELSGLSLEEMPEPDLPGPDWARLEVLVCGICGSDLAGLTFHTSPVIEPFVSFPAVLGHEILARVVEIGPLVTRFKAGDRVSVDPMISCVVRARSDTEQCPSCAAGSPSTCARAGEAGGPSPTGAPLARGLLLGANADLPGGFGQRMVAHESQLFLVPDSVEDKIAVLTEPLSIGVHAILRSQPDPEFGTLVIGSGVIALGTVWALRELGHTGPIVAQTKRPNEAALARALGANSTATPGSEAREALLATGAVAYQPIVGLEVFAGGGFPVIFDCVGTEESLAQALRFVAPRGKIILLGCAAQISALDLTFLWAREVQIYGFVGYGKESRSDQSLHTFEITHRMLSRTRAPIGELVSHSYPLTQYQEAIQAASYHRSSRAFKVVLLPNSAKPSPLAGTDGHLSGTKERASR